MGLLFTSIMSAVAFANEVQTDVDFDSLISADEMSMTEEQSNDQEMWRQPRFRYGFRCFASNRRGIRFESVGYSPQETQRDAIQNCFRSGSRSCQPMGCTRV